MGHRGKATSGYFALSARRVSERLNYKKIDVIPISYGLLRPGNAGSLANLIVEARYVARIPSVAQCQSDEPERIDGKACHGKACHGIDPRTDQARVARESPVPGNPSNNSPASSRRNESAALTFTKSGIQ